MAAPLKTRPGYDEDAIHALVQFNPKYSFQSWETEIEIIMDEEECSFREAVYLSLVENYRDNQYDQTVCVNCGQKFPKLSEHYMCTECEAGNYGK